MAKEESGNLIEIQKKRGGLGIRVSAVALAGIVVAVVGAVGGVLSNRVAAPAVAQQTGTEQRQDKAIESLCTDTKDLRDQDRMIEDSMNELRTTQRVSEQQFKEIERRLTSIETAQRDTSIKLDRLLERIPPR